MTNTELTSLVTDMGGVSKVYALVFDNNFLVIFDNEHPFSLDSLKTIGGKDYVVTSRDVMSRSRGKIDIPVTRYYLTDYLQYILGVDDISVTPDIDKQSYDYLF